MTDTDKPATPEFDMAASVARFFTERDERNRRAEAVRPDNKTALFDALAAAGITLVTVTFDGSGDSGQIGTSPRNRTTGPWTCRRARSPLPRWHGEPTR